jgi:hypothetical protein
MEAPCCPELGGAELLGFRLLAGCTSRDKVHTYDFVPTAFFIAKGNKNVQLAEPKIRVRFDSAPYLTYKKGSIFTSVRSTMNYDRSDRGQRDSSAHLGRPESSGDHDPRQDGQEDPRRARPSGRTTPPAARTATNTRSAPRRKGPRT